MEKMKDFYEDRGKNAPSRMNMNQMRNEVFKLQEFFEAETSTVPGARRVQAEQDRRIFGTDSRGRAKNRMTVEERTDFWKVFEEYKKMSQNAKQGARDFDFKVLTTKLRKVINSVI